MRSLKLFAALLTAVCFVSLTPSYGTTRPGLPAAPASVSSTLQITTKSLAVAQSGRRYKAALTVIGGSSSYLWSVASGSLPSGLHLDPIIGQIAGVPTKTETSSFVIKVIDRNHPLKSASATLQLMTASAPLRIKTSALRPGVKAKRYAVQLHAGGGTPGYRWLVKSGKLPVGLALAADTGLISGIPAMTGTSSFIVGVTDASHPSQQMTTPLELSVVAPLELTSAPLPSAVTSAPYAATIAAQGGLAPFVYSVAGGNLAAGLTLDPLTGLVSGTPANAGVSSFTLQVTDSSAVHQVAKANFSIAVSTPLNIAPVALAAPVQGQSYQATLLAQGGTPAYVWSVTSGSLPSGLSLTASTGVIAGTPAVSGSFSFIVKLQDSVSTDISVSAALTLNVSPTTGASTWYVRPDGGTRFSKNMENGQCDGLGDAPYPGKGTNQHCAFNDVRFLWQDGSYATEPGLPAYGWIGAGGDTYLIRGSLGTGVTYRVGWDNPNSACVPGGLCFGLQGDPYASPPVPPSGTTALHTRILGENYGACHTASAKTQLHGGYGASTVLALGGASYVDVSCLDLTDFSSCGRAAQTHGCNTQPGSLDDYATYGITWNNTSTHDIVTDVHIHGMANAGMSGATGDGVVMTYLDLIGNASSGWNADDGSGTTGTGTLLVQNYNISWNGCAEQYGSTAALPYADCTDDSTGGYGDGFGTATTASNPGWAATFDQGLVSYNTQDGLDALHLTGTGSSMTVTRTLAYGNMGQQIKVGGAAGTAINNIIYTNCNALRQAIPGTIAGYNSRLSDFCRAADGGVLLTVGANTLLRYDFNTIYSAAATAVEVQCDTSKGACDNTSKMDFRNNIFIGFANNSADGYPNGTGDNSTPIYNGTGVDFFANAGSLYSNNVTLHPKYNWTCPADHELSAICGDPNLTDQSWHVYGFGDVHPVSGASVVTGAGVAIPGVTVDFAGQPRGPQPTIGAYN